MSFSISAISSSVCTKDFFLNMIYDRECFCMGVKKKRVDLQFFFLFTGTRHREIYLFYLSCLAYSSVSD